MQKKDVEDSGLPAPQGSLLVFWFITMSKCCYQSKKKHKNCTITLYKNTRFSQHPSRHLWKGISTHRYQADGLDPSRRRQGPG